MRKHMSKAKQQVINLGPLGRFKIDKSVLPIAAGGAALAVALLFIRKKTAGDTISDAEKESKDISKVQKPTYGPTQYQLFADKVYSAGVTWFGTDENAIYGVFNQLYNDLDVLELIKAFGTRRLEFTSVFGNLQQFLASEMNAKEIGQINTILFSKGIKYRF